MKRVLEPGPRTGTVTAPASKSVLHRALILAALSEGTGRIGCGTLSEDLKATAASLKALGADIRSDGETLLVGPIREVPAEAVLACGESGTTLRFLLPLAGALGVSASFLREGRLPERPLEPLRSELSSHGMRIREEGGILRAEGRLMAGDYTLPGNISSQFISGLLLALPLLPGESTLTVLPPVESEPYILLTERLLAEAGIALRKEGNTYRIPGGQKPEMDGQPEPEGSWSAAVPFLCMGALSKAGITVRGLRHEPPQGDREILDILREMGAVARMLPDGASVRRGSLKGGSFDLRQMPDAAPALAVLAALAEGETVLSGTARLRGKESDRVAAAVALIRGLGGEAEAGEDRILIRGGGLRGGEADSFGDHRIAMAAALAACGAREPVYLGGSGCVAKSFPDFWTEFGRLEKER